MTEIEINRNIEIVRNFVTKDFLLFKKRKYKNNKLILGKPRGNKGKTTSKQGSIRYYQ